MSAAERAPKSSNRRLLLVGERAPARGLRGFLQVCWSLLTGTHTLSRSGEARPTKVTAFEAMLRDGWASLHVDARRPGVILPAALRREAHVTLEYARSSGAAMPDLCVARAGVSATLSLDHTLVWTYVPWSAVFAISDPEGRAVLYREDLPNEVHDQLPPG